MAKAYTVKKKINGKEYTAQFNGISTALDAVDSCYIDGTSNISTRKLNSFLLEHVIVEPAGLTFDDFDTIEELNKVTEFAREVMQGNFHSEAQQSANKAKG